jgi:hypothetical protein
MSPFAGDSSASAVTARLSLADGTDRESILRLASLNQETAPDGPVVLAEEAGEPVAAIGIADGSLVADPSRAGPAIVWLLHLRRLEALLIGSIWGF